MGFSSLADMNRRIPDIGRSSPRNAFVTGVGVHHNAAVNAFMEAINPRREVSANYWITNEGAILPNIDESRRAWTSGMSGYPAGAAADHRNVTIEVSNSPEGIKDRTWRCSDAAIGAFVMLVADVFRRYGLGPVTRGASRGVGLHSDWVPTVCPGPYLTNRIDELVARAELARLGSAAVRSPEGAHGRLGDIEALARAAIRGEFGDGEERRRRLGSVYGEVQSRVNTILAEGGATSSKDAEVDIEALAQSVLRGEYGNGDDRRRRLGNNYAAVQARVNQLTGIQPVMPRTSQATIEDLARAVIRGDYGDGSARQAKLGVKYAEVQARVNQILGF